MKIVVYGPGCARCHETERVVRHVVEQLGITADVEKVSDYQAMAAAGRSGHAGRHSRWRAETHRDGSRRPRKCTGGSRRRVAERRI